MGRVLKQGFEEGIRQWPIVFRLGGRALRLGQARDIVLSNGDTKIFKIENKVKMIMPENIILKLWGLE